MPRILVVDDDPGLLTVCRVGLTALGHHVVTARTAEEALGQAAVCAPDVVVLDLGLPDLDGVEVCRRVRGWSDVPIVVLSADGSEDRKVEALEMGADDYVTKPFGMRELNARLQVALRHRRPEGDDVPAQMDVGALHLDLAHYEATLGGRPLELTPKEFDFVAYLARHAGKTCTRKMILESVWGPGYVDDVRYLKVYAYRVRQKLHDAHGSRLQNDPSVGYRLVAPSDER